MLTQPQPDETIAAEPDVRGQFLTMSYLKDSDGKGVISINLFDACSSVSFDDPHLEHVLFDWTRRIVAGIKVLTEEG